MTDDARCLWTVYFGMGRAGVTELIFHLNESKPTARTSAGLHELETLGLISSKPFNKLGGIVYTLMVEPDKAEKASQKLIEKNSWKLTQKIHKARK